MQTQIPYQKDFIRKLMKGSPYTPDEFKSSYGSLTTLTKINQAILNQKISGYVLIYTDKMQISYDIERVGIRNGRLYVEIKMKDWLSAMSEARLLRLYGRRAFIITDTNRTSLRIYLMEKDMIGFLKYRHTH